MADSSQARQIPVLSALSTIPFPESKGAVKEARRLNALDAALTQGASYARGREVRITREQGVSDAEEENFSCLVSSVYEDRGATDASDVCGQEGQPAGSAGPAWGRIVLGSAGTRSTARNRDSTGLVHRSRRQISRYSTDGQDAGFSARDDNTESQPSSLDVAPNSHVAEAGSISPLPLALAEVGDNHDSAWGGIARGNVSPVSGVTVLEQAGHIDGSIGAQAVAAEVAVAAADTDADVGAGADTPADTPADTDAEAVRGASASASASASEDGGAIANEDEDAGAAFAESDNYSEVGSPVGLMLSPLLVDMLEEQDNPSPIQLGSSRVDRSVPCD